MRAPFFVVPISREAGRAGSRRHERAGDRVVKDWCLDRVADGPWPVPVRVPAEKVHARSPVNRVVKGRSLDLKKRNIPCPFFRLVGFFPPADIWNQFKDRSVELKPDQDPSLPLTIAGISRTKARARTWRMPFCPEKNQWLNHPPRLAQGRRSFRRLPR